MMTKALNVMKPVLNAPSIGRQNQNVMDVLTRAKRVAVILARHGFTVLNIIAGTRNARIVIDQPAPSGLITFDMATLRCTPYHTPYATVMRTAFEGVQVEWTIRGPL